MYGKGVNADYQKAKMYFEEILNEKYDDAYYKLALLYSGDFGIQKNEEKVKEYFSKIECDLCIVMIYCAMALKSKEEQYLDEIFKLLDSEMDIVKNTLIQFPENHPAKVYYKRLSYLKKEEYEDIVEKLKSKVLKCKENKTFKELIKNFDSNNDVSYFARCIVESPYYASIEEYIEISMDKLFKPL